MTIDRKKAEEAVADHYRHLGIQGPFRSGSKYPHYFVGWESNLMQGIDPRLVEGDLRGGRGGELVDQPDGKPAKFCAPFSSSALCVNSFGLSRSNPHLLSIAGLSGFSECQLEKELPTGLGGTSPHLDLVATAPKSLLAVESKFLEPLDKKKPKFRASYEKAFAACGDETLNRVYQLLVTGEQPFNRLDAAQLLRHALGVIKNRQEQQRAILIYAYWEPVNALGLEPFATHREEIERFATLMAGGTVEFRAVPYLRLWDAWKQGEQPEVVREHAGRLMDRYQLEL